MENQTNNNETLQEAEVVENVETTEPAQTAEVPTQPEMTKGAETIETTPDDKMIQVSRKKKKTMVITLLVGALVLLLGGVGAGVYAFMNAPEMKMVNAITKIQKAKSADGTMKIQGSATIPTFLKAETVDVKIDGTYSVSRNANNGSYFKIDAQTNISGTEQFKEMIDAMQINGNYSASLTKDMIFNWSGIGQKDSISLSEEQKQTVKKLLETDGSTLTEEQKAIQELYVFALKGYTPVLENEGNKTVMKVTKAELEKIVQTVEKNIASESEKFGELYKKANKAAKEVEIKTIVKNAKDGVFSKQFQQALNMIETFQLNVAYEDLGNQVKQTFNMDMTMKQTQSGMTISTEFNFQFDTTYSL